MTQKTRLLAFVCALAASMSFYGCDDGDSNGPVGCTSDADCTDGDKTHCDASGVCVVPEQNPECTRDVDCTDGDKTQCSDGVCVVPVQNPECTSDADCTDGDKTHCDASGVCVVPEQKPECTIDADCTDGDKTQCNVNGVCIVPSKCDNGEIDEGEECDGLLIAEGIDVDCGEGKQLVETPVCIAGTCKIDLTQSCIEIPRECESDEGCAANEDGRTLCNVEAGKCVECNTKADCELNDDGRTQCDMATNTCFVPECESDEGCADREDGKTKCEVANGVCVLPPECESDEGCSEREDGKSKCDVVNGVCVLPPECESDEGCSEREDGKTKCDVVNGVCVLPPECESDEGCAEREDGKTKCDVVNGVCVQPPECESDEGCAGREDGKTKCDVEKGVCMAPVSCKSDADCADNTEGNTQCNTAKGICVKPSVTYKDCEYPDEDKDGISDDIEGREEGRDSDGDTIADYLDPDSDGDTIPDKLEAGTNDCSGATPIDSDGDTIPDYLDTDSDNNDILDSKECCGTDEACLNAKDASGLFTYCIDTDDDSYPDYLDSDNDGDYVSDKLEIVGMVKLSEKEQLDASNRFSGDCDGDGMPDVRGTAANPVDCDGDTIPDYMDTDSDNDGISDTDEGQGIPKLYYPKGKSTAEAGRYFSRYMSDADGDGISDTLECGGYIADSKECGAKDHQIVETPLPESGFFTSCVDSIGNGIPDYLEIDSDNDGLADKIECQIGSNWTLKDTDGDKEDDLSEWTAANLAIANGLSIVSGKVVPDTERGGTCTKIEGAVETPVTSHAQIVCNDKNKVEDVFDFFFELPPNEPEQNQQLVFVPQVSKLDVVFNMDTTSSMGEAIANVKSNVTSLIETIQGKKNDSTGVYENAMVSDAGFALTTFDDFPISGYGSGGDLPFRLLGAVTTDKDMVKAYTQKSDFKVRNGGDVPEAGAESLYQIATGEGVNWSTGSVPARINSVEGTWGGVGFRPETLPVVVHITDAPSHDISTSYNTFSENIAYTPAEIPAPHYSDVLIPKLKDLGIRVITLYVGKQEANKYNQMYTWAKESDAIVPLCAFSTASIAATKCKLGTETSPETINGKEKQCVLFYQGEQSQTTEFVSQGIDALVKYGTYDVSTVVRGDPDDTRLDTSCFIQKVVASKYNPPCAEPEKSCNPEAVPAMVSATDYNDGFTNFAPGTSNELSGAELEFTVYAKNYNQNTNASCVEQTEDPQIFTAYIDVVNPATGLLFGTREVKIIVPGKLEGLQVD